ncbi:unnamed protein product [Phytomonas sp. EM1]|nr:unnamed protein product [Phytomonas sp. EM1]|eukprot:CCW63959.1 unnamed protein product [Phytomonas sp. isolate EM1]
MPSRYQRRHVGLVAGTNRAFDRASTEAVRLDETHQLNTVSKKKNGQHCLTDILLSVTMLL